MESEEETREKLWEHKGRENWEARKRELNRKKKRGDETGKRRGEGTKKQKVGNEIGNKKEVMEPETGTG